MEINEERRESAKLPSYVGELKSFCSMFSERSREESNAPYVRVWIAIMQNIIADEEKSRQEAVRLLDQLLKDRETRLSDSSRSSVDSLREYLCAVRPDDDSSGSR